MRPMKAGLLLFLIALSAAASPSAAVIASETLRIKLTVPPPPISSDIDEGIWHGCIIEKEHGRITIAAR